MNKKTLLMSVLVCVFSISLWGSHSFGEEWAEFRQDWVEGIVHSYYQPKDWDSFEVSWLIGHRVHSPAGGDLGQISDLAVDRANGRIALVILSDVPGFGARFVAAPWGALERTGDHSFQLGFGERAIEVSDTYTDPYAYELERHFSTVGLSSVPATIDSRWADSLYRFFGQTPYWMEAKTLHSDIMSYRVSGDTFSLTGVVPGTSTTPGLLGSMVQLRGEETATRVVDLVIDSREGRVALLVLDNVPGRGDAMIAVPFGELSMGGNAYVLSIPKDKIASAPAFMGITGEGDRNRAEETYYYFGITPYWTMGEETYGE